MNPFKIFVIFYATAFLMEMLEKWKYPEFSLTALGIVVFLVFTRITKLKFLIFLSLISIYFLIFRFPDVANHINLLIYLNIVLIIGGIYHYFIASDRNLSRQDSEYFEIMLPLLRSALILVYFIAGFHKLNRDFLNPQVSCAKVFFLRIVSVVKTEILGLPLFLGLTIIVLICFWYLFFKKSFFFRKNKFLNVGLLVAIIPSAWGILVLLQFHSSFLTSLIPLIGFLTAIVVVTWEILGGLLLSVTKLQLPILVFSLMMHLILAPIGFVDFGALAFSLLLTFLPENYYQILIDNFYMTIFKFKINRAYLYLWINTLGGIIAGISYLVHTIPNLEIITGFLFDLSVLIFIYPLCSIIFLPTAQRPIWKGISLFNSPMPKFMWLFPLLLLAFGFSSYFGLSTAGNFSMFSNLRTEGMTSNHFLLSNNPWKVFNYQEDTVEIYVSIDDKNRNIILNNIPIQSHFLPMVEFKKLIYDFTKANKKIAMRFEYQDKVYQSRDIINDPTWKTTKQNWEMKLMNFRLISPNQLNECRW
ncbi:MAG: hypothetical protein QNJ34_23975 [Xenococcaceae cyanobacterium MO_188.B29]|nr:hypothetical protein [Xenococcaceae cyanobacterium MO_188.B29]